MELTDAVSAAEDRKDWPRVIALLSGRDFRSDPGSGLRLGRALQHVGNWDSAEEMFLQVREHYPTLSDAALCLGLLAIERVGDQDRSGFEAAERWYDIAVGLRPDAIALTLLGATKVALNDPAAGEECFRRAIAVDSEYEEAYYNLAELLQQGLPEEAMELLAKAVELDPDYAAAHQLLGKLMHKSGDPRSAEHHFRRARELDPRDAYSALYLANCLAVLGRVEEARAEYEQVIRMEPENRTFAQFYANFMRIHKL